MRVGNLEFDPDEMQTVRRQLRVELEITARDDYSEVGRTSTRCPFEFNVLVPSTIRSIGSVSSVTRTRRRHSRS